jgi:hypothetical protein
MSFEAFSSVLEKDHTAVVIDAREADAFQARSFLGLAISRAVSCSRGRT